MRAAAGLALAALALGVLGGRLGEGDLRGDPVIYAALAKEMVRGGDWLTLHLAGQPFFDKPPLVMWLAALAFETFGVSVWSARLPGVALAVVACLVLWRLGAELSDERVGLAAAAMLALTPGFVRFGSTLLLDPVLVAAALLGLRATARAFARDGRGLWIAGLWFGVAFLAKGALALEAPAVLAVLWAVAPDRPPFRCVAGAAGVFLAVVLPWHLYETWRWDGAFVRGVLSDVSEKLGTERPEPEAYVRALLLGTLPWLLLAGLGAWRVWRRRERGPAIRLLTVWTLTSYGVLFLAAKHSPRYLMLVHPALALWAALALRPLLPAPSRLAVGIAGAAVLAWAVVALWPRPLHPGGRGDAVTALLPDLGPPGVPLVGFRTLHEGTRATFSFYLDRDLRSHADPEEIVRLGSGTPVVVALRDVAELARDGRFEERRRSDEFAAFRVR